MSALSKVTETLPTQLSIDALEEEIELLTPPRPNKRPWKR